MDTIEKAKEIARLLESFPQTKGNKDVLLDSFLERLNPFTDDAVARAVRLFRDGDVPEQSKRFAPSVPEFIAEARRSQDFLEGVSNVIRFPVRYPQGNLSPFEVKRNQLLSANAHLPVLFEGIDHAQFLNLHKSKQIPVGGKWVAFLGTVYGPPAVH